MNFRRGFFRLWLIVSLLWVLLIVVIGPGLVSRPLLWHEIADGWEAQRERAAIPADTSDTRLVPVLIDARIERGHAAKAQALNLGKFAVVPPLSLLICGALIGWVFSGFRRN